jgi:hypothetical protein
MGVFTNKTANKLLLYERDTSDGFKKTSKPQEKKNPKCETYIWKNDRRLYKLTLRKVLCYERAH